MTKTIEELQAQRIKELDESRNELFARIAELKATNKKLENKLEVATDECVWFANKNHQLQAENKRLKEDLELTECALHREVEEHAKAAASMRKFFYKNVELTGRLKAIEEHLL